jgi:hypothetical protein
MLFMYVYHFIARVYLRWRFSNNGWFSSSTKRLFRHPNMIADGKAIYQRIQIRANNSCFPEWSWLSLIKY